jgi:hypothetical protein
LFFIYKKIRKIGINKNRVLYCCTNLNLRKAVEKHDDNSFYREKMENSGEGYMNEAAEEEKKFPIAQFPPHMYLDPGHQTLG